MPNFTDFQLSDEDLAQIDLSKNADGSIRWTDDALLELKLRIKILHKILQRESCCYCRRGMHGEFDMVIDIEHILPKTHFPMHIFSAHNLSISCKRCNMSIKRSRTDFLVVQAPEVLDDTDSASYRFIHPNLDIYRDHLKRVGFDLDDGRLVKYLTAQASAKGKHTYEFFRLHELEIDSFDSAQGMAPFPESQIVVEIRRLTEV